MDALMGADFSAEILCYTLAMTIFTPTPSSTADGQMSLYRFSVERYHAMRDAGVLTTEDRIELIFGQLVEKMPIKPSHRIATVETRRALEALTPSTHYVESQQPMTTADSEPEPDVFMVRGQVRDYVDRHPYPADIPLVVEVADATLVRDQTAKKMLYAQCNIPVYWIVNLVRMQVEVYSQPSAGMYAELRTYRAGDAVPVVVDGEEIGRIPVASMLP